MVAVTQKNRYKDSDEEVEELRQKLAQAEASLKESEEKFARLSNATHEAVIVHENGKPQEINDNFTRLFGYSLAELESFNGEQLFIAPESRELVTTHFGKNHDDPYEAIGLKKDGTKFDIELSCKTCKQNGSTIGVVAIRAIRER